MIRAQVADTANVSCVETSMGTRTWQGAVETRLTLRAQPRSRISQQSATLHLLVLANSSEAWWTQSRAGKLAGEPDATQERSYGLNYKEAHWGHPLPLRQLRTELLRLTKSAKDPSSSDKELQSSARRLARVAKTHGMVHMRNEVTKVLEAERDKQTSGHERASREGAKKTSALREALALMGAKVLQSSEGAAGAILVDEDDE